MKPFAGNHDIGIAKRNQKLSNTRVILENVFVVLSPIYRIFKKSIYKCTNFNHDLYFDALIFKKK